MNYRHLQYFVQVVRQGSIKGAAEQLQVSQPAVSSAIRNLEKDFGAKLLDRRREGSVPTVYGKSLYESAITMGSVVTNAREKIAALKDPSREHLRIGTGPSVSIEHVATAISELLNNYPDLQVTHMTSNSHETFEQLLIVRDIDIALCHIPVHRVHESLDGHFISDNPIGALVCADHLKGDRSALTAMDMTREFRWITPRDDAIHPPKTVPRQAQNYEPPITVLSEDLQMIKDLTLTTRSVGFLPLHMAEQELQSGKLVELVLDGAEVSRPIYALTRKATEKSLITDRFVNTLVEVFKNACHDVKPHKVVKLVYG